MKTKTVLLMVAFTLVWIVVLAPAHIVGRLLPGNAPLVLQGISGSVWSGSVAQAALTDKGQVLAQGGLRWRISPLSVLRLSPCADFVFEGSDSDRNSINEFVTGVVCISTSGELSLREVAFDLSARRLLRASEIRLGGEVSGVLTELTWYAGDLVELQGYGLWSNAMIRSGQLNLLLNSLPFTLTRDSGNSLLLKVDNQDLLTQEADTPLHIALHSTVALGGQFHTQARLTTQPQAPDDLIELLEVLAEPQGAGSYTLEMRSISSP